jgi:biotin transporter BioY
VKKLAGFLVSLIIWIIGCAIFDYFLKWESSSYIMMWGAIVYIVADTFKEVVEEL